MHTLLKRPGTIAFLKRAILRLGEGVDSILHLLPFSTYWFCNLVNTSPWWAQEIWPADVTGRLHVANMGFPDAFLFINSNGQGLAMFRGESILVQQRGFDIFGEVDEDLKEWHGKMVRIVGTWKIQYNSTRPLLISDVIFNEEVPK